MGVPHIITLLKVANNDLSTLEYRCSSLKQKVNSLQEQERNLYNQVTQEGSNLEVLPCSMSKRESLILKVYGIEESKVEALATHFESNNSDTSRLTDPLRRRCMPPYPT